MVANPCALDHEVTVMPIARYTATIQEPGNKPQQIVCCHECAFAINNRNPDGLAERAKNHELVTQLKRQLPDRSVKIPKPVRIRDDIPELARDTLQRDPPRRDPPSYGRSLL